MEWYRVILEVEWYRAILEVERISIGILEARTVVRRGAFVERVLMVQECMRIVKKVQGGVFESGICLGDAQSIDKVRGKDLFGWRVC
jgi:hypothetical protein